MSISLSASGVILLSGVSLLEDAEELLRLLIDNPDSAVDWRACESCHAAILQVLMAAGPRLIGPPRSQFLKRWMDPDGVSQ